MTNRESRKDEWLWFLADTMYDPRVHTAFEAEDLVQEGRIAVWKISTIVDACPRLLELAARASMFNFVCANTNFLDGTHDGTEGVVLDAAAVLQLLKPKLTPRMADVLDGFLSEREPSDIRRSLGLTEQQFADTESKLKIALSAFSGELSADWATRLRSLIDTDQPTT